MIRKRTRLGQTQSPDDSPCHVALCALVLQILVRVKQKGRTLRAVEGGPHACYRVKRHHCKVTMNTKKGKAIHRSCLRVGQMILMLEVDLTVPKRQSHCSTGNENKSTQAASPNRPLPSGSSHLGTSRTCGAGDPRDYKNI